MLKIDRDKIVWRKVEGETVVLNLDTGFYYTLDELGGFIWDMTASERSLEQIVAAVIQGYDIDEPTASADIEKFLGDMRSEGLFVE